MPITLLLTSDRIGGDVEEIGVWFLIIQAVAIGSGGMGRDGHLVQRLEICR
jgi:hypothetical protein